MDIFTLQSFAASNDWRAIFPEMVLGCLALLLLVMEIVLPKDSRKHIPTIAIMGQFVVLFGLLVHFESAYLNKDARDTFNGLLIHTHAGQVMRLFLITSSICVCFLARVSLKKQVVPRIEFFHVVLVVTAALMLLVQSNHFVMLFVALETVTVGFYVLVSYYRSSTASLEAGLKYLVMGALSSALLLFGIVLLYGVAGNPTLPGHTGNSMQFDALAGFLETNPHNFLAAAGIVLVLAGVGFKIGSFPFQVWIPDVYQGAPTPVTAFLAVASKGAGFAVLLILVNKVFVSYDWVVIPALTVMAAATILFGNLAALTQHNVKRLIGLSGVSHAGFLLLGVAASRTVPMAVGAVYFYLFAYLIATFVVFGVMAHLAGTDDSHQPIDDYAGLFRKNPFLALILAVGIGSLAGIPPLMGFMGKLFIFIAAYKAGLYGLLGIAITGVALSIYYYFGWIKAAFFDDQPANQGGGQPAIEVGYVEQLALGVLALATVVLGFYQGPIGYWLSSL